MHSSENITIAITTSGCPCSGHAVLITWVLWPHEATAKIWGESTMAPSRRYMSVSFLIETTRQSRQRTPSLSPAIFQRNDVLPLQSLLSTTNDALVLLSQRVKHFLGAHLTSRRKAKADDKRTIVRNNIWDKTKKKKDCLGTASEVRE